LALCLIALVYSVLEVFAKYKHNQHVKPVVCGLTHDDIWGLLEFFFQVVEAVYCLFIGEQVASMVINLWIVIRSVKDIYNASKTVPSSTVSVI
jgi:hypothetical protein